MAIIQLWLEVREGHESGRSVGLPVYRDGGKGSVPGQKMWNLYFLKWQRDKYISEHFGFT